MKKIIPALLLGLVAAASLPGYATPISTTIDLNTVFTGNTPDGPFPWLIATFTSNTGSNIGQLTLTSALDASDSLKGAKNASGTLGWGFFLDAAISSMTCASSLTNNCASNVFWGGNYNAGSVGGNWNLAFGWHGSRFDGSDTAVYTITFKSALTDSPFVANADGWLSVAHVQEITGGCSGWVVSGNGQVAGGDGLCTGTPPPPPPTNVPEPSVLGMFGLGALMIGLFAGRRRRQQQGR